MARCARSGAYHPHVALALVHLDDWRGNVLWDRGQTTAVVDWEEAACGDPVVDVAYCRDDDEPELTPARWAVHHTITLAEVKNGKITD